VCTALPVWHALAHVPECASKKSAAILIEPGDVNGEESVIPALQLFVSVYHCITFAYRSALILG